jgi:hypothetical protein
MMVELGLIVLAGALAGFALLDVGDALPAAWTLSDSRS